MSAEQISSLVASLGGAYIQYGEILKSNGIDGHFLYHLDEHEFDETLSALEISNVIHKKNLRVKLMTFQKTATKSTDEIASPLSQLDDMIRDATNLHDKAQFGAAKVLLGHALVLAERTGGADSPPVLSVCSELGNVLCDMRAYSEAKGFLDKALKGRVAQLGATHPDTISSLNNSAVLLMETPGGDLNEARAIFEQALHACESTLGKDHPTTLGTVTNLGVLLQKQGRLKDSKALIDRALRGYLQELGPTHKRTVSTMTTLAHVMADLQNLTDARGLVAQALKEYDANPALGGPDHPVTIAAVYQMGVIEHELGRLDRAKELYERALKCREMLYGSRHPDSLMVLNNLSVLLMEQDQLEAARGSFARTLAGRQSVLGELHTDTLSTMHNYGVCHKSLGKYAEARELLENTLRGRDQVLGKDHHDTVGTVCELAKSLQLLKMYDAAGTLYERALGAHERTVGYGDGLQCLGVAHTYGQMYVEITQLDAAKKIYERAYAGQARAVGAGSIGSLKMLICLGNVTLRMGLKTEAQAHYSAVVRTHDALRVTNWDDPLLPDYFITCYNLAGLLRKQGGINEAKKMYKKCLEGFTKLYGEEFSATLAVKKRLQALL